LHSSLVDFDKLVDSAYYGGCKVFKERLEKNLEEKAEKLWLITES
jgi:hypothetical protein